jgi:hypothetical protein
MDKFWEWVEEKGYGEKSKGGHMWMYGESGDLCSYNPQMLLGYMLEYLAEVNPGSELKPFNELFIETLELVGKLSD